VSESAVSSRRERECKVDEGDFTHCENPQDIGGDQIGMRYRAPLRADDDRDGERDHQHTVREGIPARCRRQMSWSAHGTTHLQPLPSQATHQSILLATLRTSWLRLTAAVAVFLPL
jgi:hypothetical protein